LNFFWSARPCSVAMDERTMHYVNPQCTMWTHNALCECKVNSRALHTTVVGWADKGFEQFDWWRIKICPLGLYTRGQRPIDKGLQNAYKAALFGSFVVKSLSGGGKLVYNIYGNPNSPRADKLLFLNLYKVYNFDILTPKR
jgi:hypothetical protein